MPGVALYESAFTELEPKLSAAGPPWVHDLRRAGLESFRALGFPSLRNEDWRFTRTRPIAEVDFQPAGPARPGAVSEKTVVARTFDDRGCIRLTLVNGGFVSDLSCAAVLPAGLWAGSLAEALRDRPDRVRRVLGRGVDFEKRPFAALNTAFLHDGVYIEIADGTTVEMPIHIVHVAVPGTTPTVAHPRIVVAAGRNARAAIVESYANAEEGRYFTNTVSEIVCGENSSIKHWKVQRDSTHAFHVAIQHASIHAGAVFYTANIMLGGALVRSDVHSILDGEGIDCSVDGLYLARDRQHVDNHTFIRHAKPRCHSFERYKGILDGHARGVFNGKIYVDPGAQKTDAKQENNCILLSDEARINSNPQLEIFADDVKCTHGAAIGKTDDDAMFYIRTRGIDEQRARDILLYAFASEVLERIEVEPLRVRLECDLFEWLRYSPRSRA